MRAFIKTLFGDAWNIAGVALMIAVAGVLVALHRPDLAVFAMPATGLGVVAILARH
jgi:hypothetical protein